MLQITVNSAQVFLGKCFKVDEGVAAAVQVSSAVALEGRRVVIIDHPPTAGLLPLIDGLEAAGAVVHLRDHHADGDRDGATVTAVCERLGDRAVVRTRAEHPACSSLLEVGEFADAIVVADADQDGVTAALKAVGVSYSELDADGVVLDGPASGKTREALSPHGFLLVRAWGGLPPFGDPQRDRALLWLVNAFVDMTANPRGRGFRELEKMAAKHDAKVRVARDLSRRIRYLVATSVHGQVSLLDVRGEPEFDQPALSSWMDRDVSVSVLIKADGPIGKATGAQVSISRTRIGEAAGLSLAALVPSDWPRGLEHGVISNTPFLLHLSLERWEEFRPLLLEAVSA